MANFLALLRVKVKLVKTFMQELVRADDSLLELREFFRKLELLDISERPGRGSGGPDMSGCFEEFHVGKF